MQGTINIPGFRVNALLGSGSSRYVRQITIGFDCFGEACLFGEMLRVEAGEDILGWGSIDGPSYQLIAIMPDGSERGAGNVNKAAVDKFLTRHADARLPGAK